MTRLGTCASCRGDIMLVKFDNVNGCRFCTGCAVRGPEAVIAETELGFFYEDDLTPTPLGPDDPTRVGPPDAGLLAQGMLRD